MFQKSVVVDDETVSASDVKTWDLPINPVSHLLFTLKGLNVTDESTRAEILARLTKIQVTSFSRSVVDISGADLDRLNMAMFGHVPILTNKVADDNATRAITLIIPFGSRLFSPEQCHPKTQRGEFKLQVTYSATETAFDGLIQQVEAVELPGVSPGSFLRCTTISDTPAATGEMDVDLPIGSKLAGLLLYATTVPTGTAWTATLDWVSMRKDNVEHVLAKSKWESLHGALLYRLGDTGDQAAASGDDLAAHYAFVDFDPNLDGKHLVDTAGASGLKLRLNAGDTNAFRVIPLEIVSV